MDPNAMMGMLDGFWDMPMVSGIAFHPSAAEPKFLGATTGPIRDGTFDVAGGDKISYRLYVPEGVTVKAVVYYFHGNAMVCTDADHLSDVFHAAGAALLSVDFRGFAWGTGQPSLTKLCSDADECFGASLKLLESVGFGDAALVMCGRSIGASCAVHLAATRADKVRGLIIDNGLMSVKQLPVVAMMAPQLFGPQGEMMLQMLPEPFDTVSKLSAIACPTLVMHAEQDEIVPVAQGVLCHERIPSEQKKLRRWTRGGHNDVTFVNADEWNAEVRALVGLAVDYTNPFPAGVTVEAHSLSNPDFNGLRGKVLGPQGERFRVAFPSPMGEKALKPANLKIVDT
uniref:Serine aminopeptidase S33 domain-containing protein n=1 Tax=Noctiluca scintillans TaxID=2966 RepID=A0A7S1FHN3_NOCSC|mmetsp:Transcript_65110/g.172475  ORF Transcript_65110/g.172475 Transcript_65110/m.172475 type:complete len:341 (+) Transcript_65110:61-1083(+)